MLASRLHPNLLKVLPAMHHLTGADYTSKVGQGKRRALNAHPEEYLLNFARGIFMLIYSQSFQYFPLSILSLITFIHQWLIFIYLF